MKSYLRPTRMRRLGPFPACGCAPGWNVGALLVSPARDFFLFLKCQMGGRVEPALSSWESKRYMYMRY